MIVIASLETKNLLKGNFIKMQGMLLKLLLQTVERYK